MKLSGCSFIILTGNILLQYETKKRSILKALSWRTWATITTAIIVFVFTGEVALAITVGFLEVFAKMGLYFFHERLWQKISFGKKEIPSFVLWFTGPGTGRLALGWFGGRGRGLKSSCRQKARLRLRQVNLASQEPPALLSLRADR